MYSVGRGMSFNWVRCGFASCLRLFLSVCAAWRSVVRKRSCLALCAPLFVLAACSSQGQREPSEGVRSTSEAVTAPPTSGPTLINCGGPATGQFVADNDFCGGTQGTRVVPIDLSGVSGAGPVDMYQSQRFGDFTYTLPGFVPSSSNLVRLHFADTHWTTSGRRSFNVSINGKAVLTNFDIIAEAGAGNKALVKEFTVPADATGAYVIEFHTLKDAATISGIEIGAASKGGAAAAANAQILLPHGTAPATVLLGAGQNLVVGDNVTLPSTASTLLTAASGTTTLGKSDKTGGIVSTGNVTLNTGAAVTGSIVSQGTITIATGATVSGAKTKSSTLSPPDVVSWPVSLPGDSTSRVSTVVQTGRDKILFPDAYGNLDVQSGAKLYLRDGNYYFHSINIRSGAQLILESQGGMVYLYSDASFVFDGAVTSLGGSRPFLFAGYFGTQQAHVAGNFRGTLAAPSATVDVGGSSFLGSLFAQSIQVASNATLGFEAAPWDLITGHPLLAPTPIKLAPSPALLSAVNQHKPTESSTVGTAAPSSPVKFEIPARLPVSEGNAANFPAVLTFTTGTAKVTCNYKGGSSTAHPTDQLDVAKGQVYLFQSCSNGLTAGASTTGTNFQLTVQGDPQAPGMNTAVTAGLGGGCGGDLESPIPAADSVAMVRSFDWSKTKALPERTADGKPTLYYANIYIRNENERKMLDKFRIHWQRRPIFDNEMAPYSGKCGTISYRDDGEGMFVFAVIPGITYNKLREATSSSAVKPEQRVVFKAIVLRPPPAAASNADGSLSYTALMNTGFYYLNVRALPSDAALDSTDLPGGAVAALVDVVEFVATVANAVAQEVTVILGAVDRWIQGSVRVGIQVDVLNRDARFPGKLTAGWGPEVKDTSGNSVGRSLSVPGMQVSVMQWAQRIYTLGIPLPTTYIAHVEDSGHASVLVAKGGSGFGGGTSSRGSSGICLELKNSSAMMTSFLLADELCDFPVINATNPTDANTVLGNFQKDGDVAIQSDNVDLVNLAEITDSHDFYTQVVGGPWRRAKVLRGANAAVLSVINGESAWAPCLGFGSNLTDAVVTSTLAIPVVGTALAVYLGIVGTSDIILPPKGGGHYTNRGVATHETGHYVLCNLVNEAAGSHAVDVFTNLGLDTMSDGSTIEPDDDPRLLNEAFADFFASEVVSGANYWAPTNADFIGTHNMSFCAGTAPCMDANDNFSGRGDEANEKAGHDEIKKISTILFDAFDGRNKFEIAPTNGDAWVRSGTDHLVYTTTAYGDIKDENVVLTGPRLRSIVDHFIQNGEGSFQIPFFKRAIVQGIVEESNWCEACNLFILHESYRGSVRPPAKWAYCNGTLGSFFGGLAPDPNFRLNANTCTVCPPHMISDQNGQCVSCADREVQALNACSACPAGQIQQNNACVACPSDQISSGNACASCPGFQVVNKASNTCVDCPAGQIKSGNACVACPVDRISQNNMCVACTAVGQGANKTTNSCADCPDDAVIDGGQLQSTQGSITVPSSTSHAANDFCPAQFWVKVNNIASGGLDFFASAGLETQLSGNACNASTASEILMTQASSGAWQTFSSPSSAGVPCVSSGPINTCTSTCDYPNASGLVSSDVKGQVFRIGGSAVGGSPAITVSVQGAPPPPPK